MPADFDELAGLVEDRADSMLWSNFLLYVHPVRYAPGHLEFRPAAYAPKTLAADLIGGLQAWTGERWMVSLSGEPGGPTVQERRDAAEAAVIAEAAASPVVQAVLAAFPGAKIAGVRDLAAERAAERAAEAMADGRSSDADAGIDVDDVDPMDLTDVAAGDADDTEED